MSKLSGKIKRQSDARELKNEVRQKVKTIRRRLKQIQQADSSCVRSRIIAADREIERFHRFFKDIA